MTIDRSSIARLFTDALSKPAATQIKALKPHLDDGLTVGGQIGPDAIGHWLANWPGKSLFRTGTWVEPMVSGGEVVVVCDFDERAAYFQGVLTLSISRSGSIEKASLVVKAAPGLLGDVITRTWGARRAIDQLPDHLAATYGITVERTAALDNGVLRVDRKDGSPWVVRVFPDDRAVSEVKGDAAILSHLEKQGLAAERVAAPVSTFEGQGVLVTEFVAGGEPKPTMSTVKEMADWLGRLHALHRGPAATKRPGGGLHLYSADASVAAEIDTARQSLADGAFRGTDKRHEQLLVALTAADDFSTLPAALTHPDFHFKNVVAGKDGLVPIDWAGSGRGPRVLALAVLLFYGSLAPKGWDPKRVEAMMAAYSTHISPTEEELDRLAEAMQHRMLIHSAYNWCVGMARNRKPLPGEWPKNRKLCEEIASRARVAG